MKRLVPWIMPMVIGGAMVSAWTWFHLRPGGPAGLWPAPHFAYVDQDARPLSSADLAGRVWIADFIFTRCTAACPMLTARMRLLQQRLDNPELRFISFSVDPAHDSPAVLKEYAERWGGDARWRLLSTTPEGIRTTAAGMRVALQDTGEVADPILHSNRFVLVDGDGMVRGLFDSGDDEATQRLVAEVARLAPRKTATPRSAARDGAALFTELGCRGCHSDAKLAPSLAGLAGQPVTLAGGAAATADDAYLRGSITAPAAKLVAGYPAIMPSYAERLDAGELAALVEHIKSLHGPRAAPVTQAIDPVCKMEVAVTADTPRAEHRGHPYYFCSEPCRAMFATMPGKYTE